MLLGLALGRGLVQCGIEQTPGEDAGSNEAPGCEHRGRKQRCGPLE